MPAQYLVSTWDCAEKLPNVELKSVECSWEEILRVGLFFLSFPEKKLQLPHLVEIQGIFLPIP